MIFKIFNHIALGAVFLLALQPHKTAIVSTLADDMQYEIDLIDLLDY